jgi:hypothetical protein
MFNLRHKRTSRDRQSGLVFQWRLPVGSHIGFISAVGLVGLLSVGLAAVVRVRVAGPPRLPERRGSLILVPQGKEWRTLEMLALEAGPMPRGQELALDPAVRSLVERGISDATPPGYAYQPQLRPVAVEFPGPDASAKPASAAMPGVLPPLPPPSEPAPKPPLPDPPRPLVLSQGGIRTIAPALPAPAGLVRGNRYVLGYDAAGRVVRVTPLFPADPAADDSAELWLRQVTIEGGAKDGGWTAVEISSGS